jgi:hypothetical protein
VKGLYPTGAAIVKLNVPEASGPFDCAGPWSAVPLHRFGQYADTWRVRTFNHPEYTPATEQ